MKKKINVFFKLFALFQLSFFNSELAFTQSTRKNTPQKIKPTLKPNPIPKSNGTLVIFSDMDCTISFNGTEAGAINKAETKSYKQPIGNLLFKATLVSDNTIFFIQEIEITENKQVNVLLNFQKEINERLKEDQLRNAITEYKNLFSNAGCNSSALVSKINTVQNLNYSIVKRCSTCNGIGQITDQRVCNYCEGSGDVSCSGCKGSGYASCSGCTAGKGKRFCSCATITISDKILNGKTWPPRYYHYLLNCNICGGSSGGQGLINCSSCNGTGEKLCSSCNGNGNKKCRSCKNGYITNKQCCDICKGIGRFIE